MTFLLITFIFVSGSSDKTDFTNEGNNRLKRKSKYLTAYACEENHLNITCSNDLILDIIRANYGRFSITICNDNGNTDWSVNCMSPRTLRVIKARCGNKGSCIVPVDSTIFGDPCPGTFKYVEVHYQCTKEVRPGTTTESPKPSWFPLPHSNPWSTLNQHLSEINKTISYLTTTKHPRVDLREPEETTTRRVIQVKVPKPFLSEETPLWPLKPSISMFSTSTIKSIITSTSISTKRSKIRNEVQFLSNFTRFCPPVTSRGLFWNWTHVGKTAVVMCPEGSSGFAKWECRERNEESKDVNWSDSLPSLGECRSKWTSDLDSKLRQGIPIKSIVKDLADLTQNQNLFASDIILTSKMLKHIAERTQFDLQKILYEKDKEDLIQTLVHSVVTASSNLINERYFESWADLDEEDKSRSLSSLLNGVKDNAFLLANVISTEKIIIKATENILLSIRVIESQNIGPQRFPSLETNSFSGNSIEIQGSFHLPRSTSTHHRLFFTLYKGLEHLVSQTSLRFVNSHIMFASLGKTTLVGTILITFKHIRVDHVSHPECVTWDETLGSWKSFGCALTFTNSSHSVCKCDALTHFALFMTSESPQNEFVPSISVASAIVASVASIVSLSILLFFTIILLKKNNILSRALGRNSEASKCLCWEQGSSKDIELEIGRDRGNFYTVNPKLNGGTSSVPLNSRDKNDEAQQYFEYMIRLQKTPQSSLTSKNGTRRGGGGMEGGKNEKYGRGLSPNNHIYMEIDESNSIIPESQTSNIDFPSNVSAFELSKASFSKESKPLITKHPHSSSYHERNLLHTISGVLYSQSVRLPSNSSLNSSSCMRSGRRRSMLAPSSSFNESDDKSIPVSVTTCNGNQFVCLTINQNGSQSLSRRPGFIQAPVHSQQVLHHGISTMPRLQYAHPINEL